MKSKILGAVLIGAMFASSAASSAAADPTRYWIARGGITSSQDEHRGPQAHIRDHRNSGHHRGARDGYYEPNGRFIVRQDRHYDDNDDLLKGLAASVLIGGILFGMSNGN